MIGQAIAHYQISAKLGEGGMGEVYRAMDTKLGREAALRYCQPRSPPIRIATPASSAKRGYWLRLTIPTLRPSSGL